MNEGLATLPPRETWERGTLEAEELANKLAIEYEREKKCAQIDTAIPTVRELQLGIAVLVLRRQVAELRGDIMHAAIYAQRTRDTIMLAGNLQPAQKQQAVEALGKIEGKGRKLAEGWMLVEGVIKQWTERGWWTADRKPWEQATALLHAIARRQR
jgi:hypothetical protein